MWHKGAAYIKAQMAFADGKTKLILEGEQQELFQLQAFQDFYATTNIVAGNLFLFA